jgi:hypothetical protein
MTRVRVTCKDMNEAKNLVLYTLRFTNKISNFIIKKIKSVSLATTLAK